MPRSAILDQPSHPPNLMFDNPSLFQVEDFFNLDLLSGNDDQASSAVSPSSADQARGNSNSNISSTSSASRATSEAGTDSPAGSFANLQTPPQSEAIPSFDITGLGMGMNFDASFGGLPSIDEESIFTSSSQFFKPGTDPLAGLSRSPFDLFGSLESGLSGATSSDSQSQGAASTSTSTLSGNMSVSTIDPQLVRTPAVSTDEPSDVGADPDSDEEEQCGLVVAPVKVGGKGKARRGTLHSGGVSKKSSLPGPQSIFGSLSISENSSVFLGKGPGKGAGKGGKSFAKEKSSKDKDHQDIDDDKDDDPDDWRPSPEEYAKMNSKEKRQLRNKISARNFRIRRKEYIHTLEGDIADRDRLIEAIRSELGTTKSENNALRQEVAALKRAILEGRASPMLPPPAPLSPLSPLSSLAGLPGSSSTSTNASSSASSSHNIIKPNTHKDLPTSPRLGASPFWGGQIGGFGSLGGGITPVHTAIIPETANVFSSDPERHKENINPALNVQQPQQHEVLSQVLAQLYGNGESAAASAPSNKEANAASSSFDNFGFTDLNPFTLKTLDAYRMQLWGRIAAQSYANRSRAAYTSSNNTGYPSPPHSSPSYSPKSINTGASVPLSGLASNLRPQYFAPTSTNTSSNSSTNKTLGSLLSGKGLHHGLLTPPPSPQIRSANRQQQQQQQQKQREQAQTHALLATLASQTVLSKLGSAFWDAFCGPSSRSSSQPNKSSVYGTWDVEKIRRVLDGSAVLRVVDVDRSSSSAASTPTSNSTQASTDALAEGMRNLSLDTSVKQGERERKGLFAKMSSCSRSCGKKH